MPTTIGGRLRRARVQARLSQNKVAEELGATRQMVSAWERNVARPNMSHLTQVCMLYGCGVNEILFGPDAPPGRGFGPDQLFGRIFARPGAPDPYRGLVGVRR